MKVFLDTLGCPKALVDAERLCYFVEKGGHSLTSSPFEADVIIVNTCGFINKAKEENIKAILNYAELKKQRPDLKLVVTGCLSERYGEDLLKEIPEIDSALGVRDPSIVSQIISNPERKVLDRGNEFKDTSFNRERILSFSGLNYAYLKISEGCNRKCAFCAIPLIRGSQRSRRIEDILIEAEMLTENGIRELIIVSEDTLSYGIDLYGKRMLIELLKRLSDFDFDWIRLMYLYPESYLYDVVGFIGENKKFCNYIDIPLQHVSKDILRSMNRAGSFGEYLEMVEKIREINEEIAIRSAFIVGYPEETESDFELLLDFLETAELNRVGFFEYSDEEGTISYNLKPKIPRKKVKERMKKVYDVQAKISKKLLRRMVGKRFFCIFDGEINNGEKNILLFRTEYDAPEIDGYVKVISKEEVEVNQFEEIKIIDSDEYDLIGEILNKEF